MPCYAISVVLGVKVAFLETRGRQRGIAALFLAGVFGLLGLADVAAAASNVGPVSGVVVDPAGKPAARAKVWLVSADVFLCQRATDLGRSHDGRKGQVSVARRQMGAIESERAAADAGGPRRPRTPRRGRARHVALLREAAVPSTTKIKLWEGKEFEGRMIDAAGKPIAKASIVPLLRCGRPRHRPADPSSSFCRPNSRKS